MQQTALTNSARLKVALAIGVSFIPFVILLAAVAWRIFGEVVALVIVLSSPLLWLIDRPWHSGFLYYALGAAAILGPYFAFGSIVGYFWPMSIEVKLSTLKALGIRFAVVLAPFVVLGLSLTLYALAHDS